MNPQTANSSSNAAKRNALSLAGSRTLYLALLVLLVINALGYVTALLTMAPDHSGLVVLLTLALAASALSIVVIGWLFLQRIQSARMVSSAAENLANSSLAEFAAAIEALGTGNFNQVLHPVTIPQIGVSEQGEAGELAEGFNKLLKALSSALVTLETARGNLRHSYGELWQGNELLRSELEDRRKNEEALRKTQEQYAARSGEDTHQLSAANARLEKELSGHRQAEEAIQRWEQTFKNAGWGMATINASNGVLLSLNPAFAEMHGYQPPELIGQSLARVMAPESQEDLQTYSGNGNQKKNFTYESTHVRRDGTKFPVLVNIVAVTDAGGALLYRSANFQDITERKKVEQSLLFTKEEADKAIRAKSQFLARMSHELRTPLNVILGFSQLLEMNLSDPEHNESVQHILKAGKHLLALINEVLDISRIEADKLSLSLQVVPVGEAMLSAIALIRPLALQRNIEFFDQLNSRGVKHVIADNQRLQQVFLNLLSNAVKYNKTGGRVTVWCSERADNRLAVSVTDTGSGIPSEKLSQLFTPFERLGADQVGIEGTGLGLALSKRLVELMDGSLEVSSIPGEGSTFSVALPMASSPVQKLERLSDDRLTPGEKSALPITSKLLYIEEDMSNLRLVEKLLKPYHKIGLLVAQKGEQGIETAIQHLPDMILLDLDLSDMPGEKVLQQLREHPDTGQIPVVVISANTMPKRIDQMLKQGAARYLTKPIDVNKLLVVIGESIKIRENLTA